MVSTIFLQGKAKTSDKTNKNSHEALSRIVPLLPLQDTWYAFHQKVPFSRYCMGNPPPLLRYATHLKQRHRSVWVLSTPSRNTRPQRTDQSDDVQPLLEQGQGQSCPWSTPSIAASKDRTPPARRRRSHCRGWRQRRQPLHHDPAERLDKLENRLESRFRVLARDASHAGITSGYWLRLPG